MDKGLHFRFVLAKRGKMFAWQLRGERMQLLIESSEQWPSQREAEQDAKNFHAEVVDATFDFSDPDE